MFKEGNSKVGVDAVGKELVTSAWPSLEVAFESCAVCKFRGPVWSGKGTFTARHKGRERTHEKKRERDMDRSKGGLGYIIVSFSQWVTLGFH